MRKRRDKDVRAELHFASAPSDAPVGILSRCLFGVSVESLAMEIVTNRNGEWDGIYCYEKNT